MRIFAKVVSILELLFACNAAMNFSVLDMQLVTNLLYGGIIAYPTRPNDTLVSLAYAYLLKLIAESLYLRAIWDAVVLAFYVPAKSRGHLL